MTENAFQEVGWRKAKATINMRLQHNDLFVRRSRHCFTRLNPPSGGFLGSYAAFTLQGR
jgi:hypothetical protein